MSQRNIQEAFLTKKASILIQVVNKDQAHKIKQIKRLDNVEVTAKKHSTLNFTEGTIHSKKSVYTEDDTLLSELKKYDVR